MASNRSGVIRGDSPAAGGVESVRRSTMLAEPGPPEDVPDLVLLAADGVPESTSTTEPGTGPDSWRSSWSEASRAAALAVLVARR